MSNKYVTDNMAIASYLDLNGLKYQGYEVGTGRNSKPIVNFTFEDEKGIGRDLERSYRNSKEKNFRDSLLFFRNEVFKAMGEKNITISDKGEIDNV